MSEQAALEIFKRHHLRHPGHMEYCALCEADVAAALKEAEQRADEQARLVESVEFFRDTATERAEAAEAQLTRVSGALQALYASEGHEGGCAFNRCTCGAIQRRSEARAEAAKAIRALAEPAAGAPTLASELARLGSSGHLSSAPTCGACADGLSGRPSNHTCAIGDEANGAAAAVDPDAQERGCPCLYTTPCREHCTCVEPYSSSGCSRCATYGSLEQRRAYAQWLASIIDWAIAKWPHGLFRAEGEAPNG